MRTTIIWRRILESMQQNAQRSGLPQYSADSGIKDVSVPFVLHYQAERSHWGLMGLVVYKRLLGDAEGQPCGR